MSHKILIILNSLSLIAVIIFNALAGSGNITENDIGDISNKYDTLFAPAGYAFSIWGLIYLLLIGFVTFQWYSFLKQKNKDIIEKTGIYFLLSNIANISWLFLWLNEYMAFSVVAMFLLLFSLIMLVHRLKLEIKDVPVRILMFVWWPISIYLGWIIVATAANIAAFFVALGWYGSPLSPQLWTIILILIATGIYLLLIFKRNMREAAMVGIWALVAIAVKHGNNYPGITITAGIAAFLLLIIILYHSYLNRNTSPLKKIMKAEF